MFPMQCLLAFVVAFLSTQAVVAAPPGSAQDATPGPVYDLVVYGDSSGAVVAAIAAQRAGRSVILVNPTGFVGGMSASGLGATDFLGKQNTFGGIAGEFYKHIAAAYRADFVRSFEPHVGQQVFEKMLKDAGVPVVYHEQLNRTPGQGVTMEGKRIQAITTLSGRTYRGKMFIDATYVGDLMAAAGVTYTVGRESESQYGEDLAGVRRGDTNPRVHYGQKDKDHFIKDVDPYVTAGDVASGLLPHIHRLEGLKNGQGDKKIQAYNYRVCLTTDPRNSIPIEKPAGYREVDHELLLRNFDAGDTRLPALIEPLAGDRTKVDWNSMHAVGSDYAGANWDYPEASYERRREIEKEHETYIRGFLWTLAHNPRVPEAIRKRTAAYGLPKDEFTDNGGWPWMIYIREARRMVSDYVMTQHDCEGQKSAADPVGLGSFGMDSHVVQHFVTERGFCISDGVIWRVPPRPYGISYRAIIPKQGECENLFSPLCLSATHVAHGSIRMEPVFMALSQSAAIAAGLALDQNVSVQKVPYPALRERLLAANQIVDPPQSPAGKTKKTSESQPPASDHKAQRPNIVLIMADDLGYGSLGCYGSTDIKTPHLDRLAANGLRFADFHSNGVVCSATRAALLTGRYQQRCRWVDDRELSPIYREQRQQNLLQRWAWGIAREEVTLPKLLQQSGYRTGLIGKWHLGYDRAFHPLNYGFEHFRGFVGGNVDYHTHIAGYGQKELDWWNGAELQNEEGYATDLLTKYALEFLAQPQDKPFFLYVTYGAPHDPWQGRDPQAKAAPAKTYREMIAVLDESVGKIMAALQQRELDRRTLLVFCSDNGAAGPRGVAANGRLYGKKGSVGEGGHRVPLLACWPGVIPAGKTNSATVISMDFLPTFAHLAGLRLPEGHVIDGQNITPCLEGEPLPTARALHWLHGESWAVRKGPWKLIGKGDQGLALYDVEHDLEEQHDHLGEKAEFAQELLNLHREWVKSVGHR